MTSAFSDSVTPTRTADIVSRLSIRLVLLSEAKRSTRSSKGLCSLRRGLA